MCDPTTLGTERRSLELREKGLEGPVGRLGSSVSWHGNLTTFLLAQLFLLSNQLPPPNTCPFEDDNYFICLWFQTILRIAKVAISQSRDCRLEGSGQS